MTGAPEEQPGGPSRPATNRWLTGDMARGGDYDRRFERLAASGADVHGEANFVIRLGARSVLDAGCGTGRVAVELARHGIDCVGVDLDGRMLEAARRKAPGMAWIEADLATVDLARRFDAVLLAGNVMVFVTPGTEADVVERAAAHLAPGGRLIAGFSLGADRLALHDYDRMAAAAGLELEHRCATWDEEPYRPGGDYAVSVHRSAEPG